MGDEDAVLWFRVLLAGGALGPGKIALMRAVAETGSVSAAARAMKMSHVRSVKLVAEINALAPAPLIDTRAGGPAGGGAALTALGRQVVEAYAAVEAAVGDAAAVPLKRLAGLLR
jgi:molybdate transport system regulatory protein